MKQFIILLVIVFAFSVSPHAQDKIVVEKGSKEIIGEKGSKGIIGEKGQGPTSTANKDQLKKIRTELLQLLAHYIKQANEAEATSNLLRKKFDEAVKVMKVGTANDAELQQIITSYNQVGTLSSYVQKKMNETKLVIIRTEKIIGEKGGKD